MKMPSLVRRMSVQEVREASLQEKGPKNKFEKRILEELPKAIKRVEEFYGVKLREIPPVLISYRQVYADKGALTGYLQELHKAGTISHEETLMHLDHLRKEEGLTSLERISRALKDVPGAYFDVRSLFRPIAWHNAALQSISLPPRRSFRAGVSYLQDLLTHELAHQAVWEQRSRLYSFRPPSSSLSDGFLASMCAQEGLATYPESWVHKEPEKGFVAIFKRELSSFAKSFRKALAVYIYPERGLCDIAHALLSLPLLFLKDVRRFAWGTPEKLAKAVEKSKLAKMAIDPYGDGLQFVKAVASALGGPKEAFKAITEKPPETMREVLLPEKYLSRIKSE